MLGFGKKEKSQEGAGTARKGAAAQVVQQATEAQKSSAGKKRLTLPVKKMILALMGIAILGGGGFAAYTFFFQRSGAETRVFRAVKMSHVTLPREMLQFSFDHYPDLYDAFLQFEKEMNTYEAEISRVNAIAEKYPDQQKIADRQKKVWEKGKNTLEKEFSKLEKPVRETFVLYQVNPDQGKAQIEATAGQLSQTAQTALKASEELTGQIRAITEKPPEGLIPKTLHMLNQLKKKFL